MAKVTLPFLTALESSVPEIAATGWTNWKSSHETDEWYRQIFERLAYDAVEECNTGITPFCEWRVAIDTHYQDQEIPAEWAQWYEWYLQPQRTDGSIRHQQPEHVGGEPSQQKGFSIPDGSPLQKEIRETFLDACACWDMQPLTGGVEPPTIGPRNHSWWYEHAEYTYPIYRNWFMSTTIITYMGEKVPDWCREDLFIADSGNHRIKIHDLKTLYYSMKRGKLGSENDEYNNPTGTATLDDLYIYICDTYNHRIVKIKIKDLSLVAKIGTLGDGDDEFFNPADITSDEEFLYIADDDNHRIKKHRKDDLSFVAKIGEQGTGINQFNHPYAITCDDTYLYICDSLNNRIKKHRKDDLSYVSLIASEGSGDHQFSIPSGITCDYLYLYICDTGNNRIKKHWKWSLKYVAKAGTQGSGDDQFNFPTQISCDDAYLYICDTGNNRIKKYIKYDLSFEKETGTQGSGDHQFNLPIGIHAQTWHLTTQCDDTYVNSEHPDTNYKNDVRVYAAVLNISNNLFIERIYLKINREGPYTLHLFIKWIEDVTGQNRALGVYEVNPDLFDVDTITWNNQPGTIRLISSEVYPYTEDKWITIEIDHAKALCLKYVDESLPPLQKYVHFIPCASRYVTYIVRPYITF